MGTTGPAPLNIPVFAGQGTTSINAPQTRQRALADAESAFGSTLLSACHAAFHDELSTLPTADLVILDIDVADFQRREALLTLPRQQRYLSNPVISGPTLFLIQALRYISFVETTGLSTDSLTPFSDILKRNLEYGIGILGFSSGILPACVVGTSLSAITYISRAVEAYRLAIWIGIRTQIYRSNALGTHFLEKNTTLPWSLVFLGMTKAYAENAITNFNKGLDSASLYITAITDDTCVTISGRPDVLSAFSSNIGAEYVVHKTTLDTLYHSSVHVNGARKHVLNDVASRRIRFPTFSDIKVPIRSTFTGDVITKDSNTGSLLELVVDMLLTQPVNWNLVMEKVISSSPVDVSVQLLNMGPGAGLTRSIERAFPRGTVSSVDGTIVPPKEYQQTKAKQEPIAIVGMAVNMPGAPNASKLWEILEQGINTITEIPEHRFKVSDYNDGKKPKRAMRAHTGNFIDGADEFDNKFFKISPREAKSMDPQQRVLLHTAYHALENSGYVPNSTPTSRPESFGCYVGVATHDYLQNLRNEIDVYYSTGTLKAFLSGRISYAMQLSGPSIVVDTACSSSNVALYQGARALMNRDCDAALVGGVNIITSPDMFLGLDRGHFLSPTGQCRAFDESADGYSRGEGCGMFVLKRLSDATAENDHILGVIRGIEINQSGLAHSITHPHAPTQSTLFKQVLESSGVDAHRVNVVEAHGTGTQAGDPNELESIRSVFALHRPTKNPLHITSLKANIGHLEAASGAAGLAKLLLMLQHETIPKQISLKNLNPRIAPLDPDNIIINTDPAPWLPSGVGETRMALLNNFGAAGSNTALLIEEHSRPLVASEAGAMHYVFGLSAKDKPALDELRSSFLHYLRGPNGQHVALSDISYTTTARRQIYDYRICISTDNRDELIEKLARATIVQVPSNNTQVVFVFSGQGGQYLGMGHSLYQTSPLFKECVDECHRILISGGFPGVLSIIAAGTAGNSLPPSEEFQAYQAAIFTLEYSLAKLWMSWGISPAAVVGHSLGEYAALVIANVISLKGALTLVANRVRFMIQKCPLGETGMIAINSGFTAVESALESSSAFSGLEISCKNSVIDCVVSGPMEQLKAFKKYLDTEIHCKNVILSVPFGYHSSAMMPLLDDLTAVAQLVPLHAPSIPVVSNVLGDVILPGDASVFNAKYFARHCVEPVQFDKGIRALISNPSFTAVGAWIEIGPHTTTLPMLKSNPLLPRGTLLLGSLRRQLEPWATLTTCLSQLYVSSITLHWRQVFAHLNTVACIDLPAYPLSKTKFWVKFKEDEKANNVVQSGPTSPRQLLGTEYAMLSVWAQHPSKDNGSVAIFETPISQLSGWIRGHVVGGMALCPASVYFEQVLAAIGLASQHLGIKFNDRHIVVRKTEFVSPLVYDETVERTVLTTVTVQDGFGFFSISSRTVSSPEDSLHVHGDYQLQPTLQTLTKFSRTLPVITRRMSAVISPTSEVFSTRTAYEILFPRVVEYGKEYHTMRTLTVDESGMEGCATVRLPNGYHRGKFVVHPVFVDTLLHVAGFLANMQGGVNDAYICSQVGSMKVVPHLINNEASYKVYCSNAWVPEDQFIISEAYAVEIAEPRRIVAHIKGMAFRLVPLDRFKRGLSHASKTSSKISRSRPTSTLIESPRSSIQTTPAIDIHKDIIAIFSETCDLDGEDLDIHTDLASLGVDSLMSIEIFGKLESFFTHVKLDANTLSYCTSVAEIIREVSTRLEASQLEDGDYSTATTITHSSGMSSPRTLVTDDRLVEPTSLAIDGELDVKQIIAFVLGINAKDVGEDTDFESMGLDSLTSIEALHMLKNEYGLDLQGDFFIIHPTIRSVQSYFGQMRANPKSIEHAVRIEDNVVNKTVEQPSIRTIISALRLDKMPTPIQQSARGQVPLFLIHDGSGLVNYYDRLSPLNRPVWGIHNPRFATSQPWDGVVQMASAYVDYILSQASGPVIIGGWSFGGIVAYEAALQLSKRNIQVNGILLIDSPNPINHTPLSDPLIESVVNLDGRSAGSELGRLVKTQFAMNARMLANYDPRSTRGVCPPIVLLRSSQGYKPSGVANVPQWLADRSNPRSSTVGWETLTYSPLKIIDIPGHHFEPFHPSKIDEVSLRMSDACKYLES